MSCVSGTCVCLSLSSHCRHVFEPIKMGGGGVFQVKKKRKCLCMRVCVLPLCCNEPVFERTCSSGKECAIVQ